MSRRTHASLLAEVTLRGKKLLAAWKKYRDSVFSASDSGFTKYLATVLEEDDSLTH
jgi:hypothetical protein